MFILKGTNVLALLFLKIEIKKTNLTPFDVLANTGVLVLENIHALGTKQDFARLRDRFQPEYPLLSPRSVLLSHSMSMVCETHALKLGKNKWEQKAEWLGNTDFRDKIGSISFNNQGNSSFKKFKNRTFSKSPRIWDPFLPNSEKSLLHSPPNMIFWSRILLFWSKNIL